MKNYIDFSNKDNRGHIIINADEYDFKFFYGNKYDTKLWLRADKDYLFKANCNGTIAENEIFMSYICKELLVECVKFYPAIFKCANGEKMIGVLSPSYWKNDKVEIVRGNQILKDQIGSVAQYLNSLEIYVNKVQKNGRFVFVDKKMKQKLLGMCLVDMLTFQMDRAPRNIEFYIEKENMHMSLIKLSPLFDNSWSFLSFSYYKFREILECFEAFEQNRFDENLKLSLRYQKRSSAFKNAMTKILSNFNVLLTVNEEWPNQDRKVVLRSDICDEMIADEHLMNIYKRYNKIDFKKLKEQIFEDLGFVISDKLIKVAEILREYQAYHIDAMLERRIEFKNEQEKPNENELIL